MILYQHRQVPSCYCSTRVLLLVDLLGLDAALGNRLFTSILYSTLSKIQFYSPIVWHVGPVGALFTTAGQALYVGKEAVGIEAHFSCVIYKVGCC